MTVEQKLYTCLKSVKKRVQFAPAVGIVLGSGLGAFGDHVEVDHILPYSEIGGFPVSTVDGHKGRFIFGTLKGVPVVVMQGRVHYYEGYTMQDVVLPTRLMGLLGIRALLLTNAAGGVNFDFSPGDFMMITDQIATFVPSPLIGPNLAQLGPRFPDMSAVYDRELCGAIRGAAGECGVTLREGVYVQLSGPQYESPVEVRMVRALGGDAVGMSTACEALAARHMGVRVCGISCITNLACGMTDQPLSAEEVDGTGARVQPLFRQLVTESVVKIGGLLR